MKYVNNCPSGHRFPDQRTISQLAVGPHGPSSPLCALPVALSGPFGILAPCFIYLGTVISQSEFMQQMA